MICSFPLLSGHWGMTMTYCMGKADTMAELSLLRSKYDGNARMEKVIDSDIAYVATGKFEEA